MQIEIFIKGVPIAKSYGFNPRSRRPFLSKPAREWQSLVAERCQSAFAGHGHTEPKLGPIELHLTFYMPPPKRKPSKKKREAFLARILGIIKTWCCYKPDLTNLIKSTEDGITEAGNVWGDDAQVCRQVSEKHLAENEEQAGVKVLVREL